MTEKKRGTKVLRRESVSQSSRRNELSLQHKEMYPKKVEMVGDPAEEAAGTVSFGDSRSIQRRHKGVFRS